MPPTIINADCLDALRYLPDESVHAVVTDPPYGLSKTDSKHVAETITRWANGDREYIPTGKGFMNAPWDAFVPPVAVWDECLRVLKPGGHMLVFAGSRTFDLMGLSIRLAGFDIRDTIMWVTGQGFPKSQNPGCKCDERTESSSKYGVSGVRDSDVQKAAHAESGKGTVLFPRMSESSAPEQGSEKPGCDQAREGESGLEGWGSESPKGGKLHADAYSSVPSRGAGDGTRERQSSDSSVSDVKNDWPTIDADRVRASQGSRHLEQSSQEFRAMADKQRSQTGGKWKVCGRCGKPKVSGLGTALKPGQEPIIVARKPFKGTVAANVQEHGTGAINIDACRVPAGDNLQRVSPDGTSPGKGRFPANVILDEAAAKEVDQQSGYTKDSRGRNDGPREAKATSLYNPWKNRGEAIAYGTEGGASRFFYVAKASQRERPYVNGVIHPTVKPLKLMEYLVTLVTPPGGVVLDPFAGSGTTIEAAINNGFEVIGIEREQDYLPLIQARIDRAEAEELLDLLDQKNGENK